MPRSEKKVEPFVWVFFIVNGLNMGLVDTDHRHSNFEQIAQGADFNALRLVSKLLYPLKFLAKFSSFGCVGSIFALVFENVPIV